MIIMMVFELTRYKLVNIRKNVMSVFANKTSVFANKTPSY